MNPAISQDHFLPRQLSKPFANKGKWTVEEEMYAEQIITHFKEGTLDISDGETLRGYMSKALNCDPMRISKKFNKNGSLGMKIFTPLLETEENIKLRNKAIDNLRKFRSSWVNKLLENEKKVDEMCKDEYARYSEKHEIEKLLHKKHLNNLQIMRSRLQPVLRDTNDVEKNVKTINGFVFTLGRIPKGSDIEQALLKGKLTISTLYAILLSGCCLVDDSALQSLHKAVEQYINSINRQIDSKKINKNVNPIKTPVILNKNNDDLFSDTAASEIEHFFASALLQLHKKNEIVEGKNNCPLLDDGLSSRSSSSISTSETKGKFNNNFDNDTYSILSSDDSIKKFQENNLFYGKSKNFENQNSDDGLSSEMFSFKSSRSMSKGSSDNGSVSGESSDNFNETEKSRQSRTDDFVNNKKHEDIQNHPLGARKHQIDEKYDGIFFKKRKFQLHD